MANTKFKPGQSGNPKGRPRGSGDKRNKYRTLLEPHAGKIIQAVIDRGLDGDNTCLKLCMDRLVAPYRPQDAVFEIGIAGGSLTDQGRNVLSAMSKGHLSATDATAILSALATAGRIIEMDELEKRLSELEKRI